MSTIAINHVRPTGVPRPASHPVARPLRRPGVSRSGVGQGQVRLTRRGRVVVVVAALVLVLAAAFFWGAGSVASERPGTPEPTRVVTVDQGDTLWGIAAAIAPDGEVRDMVDRIERLNALDSAMLQAGQRLRVPVGD